MSEDTNVVEINEDEFNTQLVVIEDKALTVVEKSKALEIVDDESLERAVAIGIEMGAGKKSILDHFEPFCDALHKKHKKSTTKRGERIKPFEDEIASNNAKMSKYIKERNERLRLEQEERERKDAAERKRQLTIIQNQLDKDMKKAGDVDAQIDMIINKLEVPDLPENEAEVLRSQFTILQAKQEQIKDSIATKAQKADEVVSVPSVAPPIVPASIKGLVQKKEYSVIVTNAKALCKAIGDGTLPDDIMTWNMKRLKDLAKNKVPLPGCHVTSDMKSHTRGK
jgi:hypothetical protein